MNPAMRAARAPGAAWRDGLGLVAAAVVFALAAPAGLRAGLTWSVTRQELVADPALTVAATSFIFANNTSRAITVLELTPSCGCTAARLERKTYAPGEGGRIDVTVNYGGERTLVEETVTVVTDEPDVSAQKLAVKVSVPGAVRAFERIEVQPQTLSWRRGAHPQPRIVTLRVRPNDAVRPIAIAADDAAFQVELLEPRTDQPGTYQAVVTPVDLSVSRETTITVTTNSDRLQPEWLKAPPLTYRLTAAVR